MQGIAGAGFLWNLGDLLDRGYSPFTPSYSNQVLGCMFSTCRLIDPFEEKLLEHRRGLSSFFCPSDENRRGALPWHSSLGMLP